MSDDELKVGDTMVCHGGGWSETRSLVKIARLTATQIIIGEGARERRFKRLPDSGYLGSYHREVGSYTRGTLRRATPGLAAEVAAEMRRRELLRRVGEVTWKDVPTDRLEAVVAALAAAPPSVEHETP